MATTTKQNVQNTLAATMKATNKTKKQLKLKNVTRGRPKSTSPNRGRKKSKEKVIKLFDKQKIKEELFQCERKPIKMDEVIGETKEKEKNEIYDNYDILSISKHEVTLVEYNKGTADYDRRGDKADMLNKIGMEFIPLCNGPAITIDDKKVYSFLQIKNLINRRIHELQTEIEEKEKMKNTLFDIMDKGWRGLSVTDKIEYETQMFRKWIPEDIKETQRDIRRISKSTSKFNEFLAKNLNEDGSIRITHAIDKDSIDEVADKVKDKIDEVESSFIDKIKSYLPSMDGLSKWTTPAACILGCLALLHWYKGEDICYKTVIAIAVMLLPEMYKHTAPYIKNLLKAMRGVESEIADKAPDKGKKKEEGIGDATHVPQMDLSGLVSVNNVQYLAAAIAGLVLSWAIKDGPTVDNIVKTVLKFKDFDRLRSGVYDVFEFIVEIFENVINAVRSLFGADSMFFLKDGHKSIYNLYNKAEKLSRKAKSKEYLTTDLIDEILHFESLVRETEVSTDKLKSREVKILNKTKELLKPLVDKIKKMNRGESGSRIAPLTIMLIGPSQIGKSVASMMLLKKLLKEVLPEDRIQGFELDPDSEIFCKSESSDYWEGLNNQWAQICDDCPSLNTVPGTRSFESDFINIKNTVPYNVNMAFEEKGHKFYRCRILLATSNCVTFDPKNLNYPEAFINRWDMVYAVGVKPEAKYSINPKETDFMKRMLLPGVSIKGTENDPCPQLEFTMYDLRKAHGSTPTKERAPLRDCLGQTLDFNGVINQCVNRYKELESEHSRIMALHGQVLNASLEPKKKVREAQESSEDEGTITHVSEMAESKDPDRGKIDVTALTLAATQMMMYNHTSLEGEDYTLNTITTEDVVPNDKAFDCMRRFQKCMGMGKRIKNDKDVDTYLEAMSLCQFPDGNYICPLIHEKPKTILWVSFSGDDISKRNFLTGYLLATQLTDKERRETLMEMDSRLTHIYPSMSNPLFLEIIEELNIPVKDVGLLQGCVTHLLSSNRTRYCSIIKRNLKTIIYGIFGITRDALKYLFSKENLLSGLALLAKATGLLAAGFGAYYAFFTTVKKVIGMDNFVKHTGLADFNTSVLKQTTNSLKEPQGLFTHGVESQNHSILKSHLARRNKSAVSKLTSQMRADPTTAQMIETFNKTNVFLIRWNGKVYGSLWVVAERVAIMPGHYAHHFKKLIDGGSLNKENPIELVSWNMNKEKPYLWLPDISNMKTVIDEWNGCDIVVTRLPKDFAPAPNRIGYFISVEDVEDIVKERRKGRLSITREPGRQINYEIDLRLVDDSLVKVANGFTSPFSWSYQGYTEQGDCGAVVAVHHLAKKTRGRIIGMHVAGAPDKSSSLGLPIYKEDLQKVLETLGVNYTTERDNRIEHETEMIRNRTPHPRLWSEERVECPKRSKICKSPLYGLVDKPTKKPAHLAPFINNEGIYTDPIEIAMAKQVPESVLINHKLVDIITHELYKYIVERSPSKNDVPGRIYSIKESVRGIPGDPYIRSMPQKTSAGHPKNLIAKNHGGGKKMWFSKDYDYSLTGEYWDELEDEVQTMLDDAHRGHRHTHIMLDFPKDETLNWEKVDSGKVRFISGAPMKHTIGARCYTLDFMKYLMTNRIHNGFGVGINPASSYEWGLIAKRLGSENIIEYDHSSYDGRLQPAFAMVWTKLCNLYYDDNHKYAREILDLEIPFAFHILDDLVTYRRGTNASGGYGTIMVNTSSNIASDKYAEYMCVMGTDDVICERSSRALVADLLRSNPTIATGDDIGKSIHPKYKELITPASMEKNLAKIGYKITSAKKDGRGMGDFVTLDEFTYLKRRFVQHTDGTWYGPLELDSITNQINYVNKKHFKVSDFILSVESYLHELSLHGKEEFDWRFKIVKDKMIELYDYVPEFEDCEQYFEDRENNLLLLKDSFEEEVYDDYVIKKIKSQDTKKNKKEEDASSTETKKTTTEEDLVTNPVGCGDPNIFLAQGDPTTDEDHQNPQKIIKDTVDSRRRWEKDPSPKTRWVCASPPIEEIIFTTQMDTSNEEIKLQEQTQSEHVKQGTTDLVVSQQPGFVPDQNRITNLVQVPVQQDSIRDFFKKKVEVSTVSWSTSSPILTVLDTIYIDQQLTTQTIWNQKLSGYLNFRATAVITVQINATPFMQGALYLAWKPYVNNDPDYGVYDQMHATNPVNLSQLPGHLMTISSDSMEVRIPYVGPVEFYRRDQTNPWTWGALAIVVYSPLKSSVTDSINVKTWLSFDDVEVKVPYYPQMLATRVSKGNTASEQEDTGASSGTLKRIREIVGKQEEVVKDISNLCTPPKWLEEFETLNAKALGWSKPNNSEGLTRMVRNLYFFGTNADGADISQPMSLRADNKVKIMPALGPYKGDEMSIDYIKTRWSYSNTFTWTTSNNPGDLLFTGEHRPSAWTQITNLATGPASSKTVYNMTPMCFVSQFFQNWRGDIEFKFVMVKTGFHSGALSVTYVPGNNSTNMTYSSAPYNMRTIIDIQEAEEFCLSIPYSVPDSYTDFLTKVGQIYIHVLNPLKAPSTVSNSMEILVYVRGAKNMSFQGLRADGPRAVYYTQGADVDNDGCVEEGGIGNSKEGYMESEFEALCIGEKITSLKQVMLRMEKVGLTSTVTGITQLGIKTNSTNVFGWQKSGVPAYYSVVSGPALQPTLLDTFMCCYLFQRGSTRWASYTQNNFWYSTLKMPIDWSNNSFNIYTGRWLSQTTQTSNPAPSIFASEHTTGGLVTKAPFYSRWPVTMIRPTWISTQAPAGRWDTNHYVMYEAQNSWNIADNSTTFTRSVGDDYQLGFFIGVPTVCFYF